MVSTKTTIYKSLIFAYLVLFPFGQILRTSVNLFGRNIRLHPADLVVVLLLVLIFFGKIKRPKISRWIDAFVITSLFSIILSLTLFSVSEIVVGAFYLFRVMSYIWLFFITWDIVRANENLRSTLFNSLIGVSFATSFFGWIQYFVYPDLRALAAFGWDDHYFRLIGTFLDPGFTSIIIVFGFLAIVTKYLQKPKKSLIFLSLFFLITLAFTYSRAGYLALFSGLLASLYVKGRVRVFLASLLAFVALILFLPKPGGEGVNLTRTSTIYARLNNYAEATNLIKKSPIFGVGFNNLCIARQKYFNFVTNDSHACSGIDSSLLFVLATSGFSGFFIFIGLLLALVKDVPKSVYGLAFLSSLAAVVVHSLFLNSLFYPWVMGYLGLLGAVALKKN